ncbi:MAG TPA: hypothetical protein PKA16_09120 [Ottowia sp.]|uniref:hypothetical protein n=1 Tax=Ottowia sp. TaxID=1898956 RepID=UPI002C43D318|nr:hypothetical protein [Ottowia sp.]HMN21542.1 hypothetical protein [Ottowia sp.]
MLPVLLLAAATGTQAQTAPVAADAPVAHDRQNQRIERIQVEDSGSRIDELRAGGQTQRITVQPKTAVPAYDVQPVGAARPSPNEAGPGSAGPRTWKILQF